MDAGATSLSKALKSNKALTELNLGGKWKGKRHTKEVYHQFTFFHNVPIDNRIYDMGIFSLCEALKSNTTFTRFNLESKHKRKRVVHKQYLSSLFYNNVKDNHIEDMGATSLSQALQSNTTLTELNLWSKHETNSMRK